MSLKKFLAKHSGELASVATVLGAVVHALPIDRQDKNNLGRMIDGLGEAAERIGAAAADMPSVEAGVSPSMVKAAIEEMLPNILGNVAERVFEIAAERDANARAAATPPAPAPAPAPAPGPVSLTPPKAKAKAKPARRKAPAKAPANAGK